MQGLVRRVGRPRWIVGLALVSLLIAGSAWGVAALQKYLYGKHVRVVVPGKLVRGAWQSPSALRRLIERYKIRTIVTLTAINQDDPKYVGQAKVVRETGVAWIIVPMRGSQATLEQMAEAADLLAAPERQPVFFHCVGGHHRTGLAHAAYLMRHAGFSAEQAWDVLAQMPWSRPWAASDQNDRRLVREFARSPFVWTSRRTGPRAPVATARLQGEKPSAPGRQRGPS